MKAIITTVISKQQGRAAQSTPQSTPACPLSLSDFKAEIRFKLWTACDQIPAPIRTRGQQCHLTGLLEEPASLPTVTAHNKHSHILTQGLKTTIMTTTQLHSQCPHGGGVGALVRHLDACSHGSQFYSQTQSSTEIRVSPVHHEYFLSIKKIPNQKTNQATGQSPSQ